MLISIFIAAGVVGAVGVLIGIFLGLAGLKFKVEVDPKEEAILGALPGNNCGGCGYAGCSGLAAAITKGEAPANACPVGGEAVAKVIGDIMGVQVEAGKPMVAFVHCQGDCEKANTNYEYNGAQDCAMMNFVPGGGPKACRQGCAGYGNCVKACPFDAIHVQNGIAVVDRDACKACGKCVQACPKHLISLIPKDARYVVACKNSDKGPVTMKACSVGCIGCGICAKNCPQEAVSVQDFCAQIDPEKCVNCGTCAEKCPKKAIKGV